MKRLLAIMLISGICGNLPSGASDTPAFLLQPAGEEGAGGKFVLFKYGNLDSWVTRHIKESAVIGGATKTLYEIGPTSTVSNNTPYTNKGGSPWATSNVMAKVSGITKTNNTVYKEKRGNG